MSEDPIFHAIGYDPSIGQRRYHDSDARWKLLIAGARFGKSFATAREVLADLLCGGGRGWMVGPTYALTRPEFHYLHDDALPAMYADYDHDVPGGYDRRGSVETAWGAEMHAMSAMRPEGLLGQEIDWLVLCEAAHLRADTLMRYLRARLASRGGRMVIPTTPRGQNWVFDLFEQSRDASEGSLALQFATADNPGVSASEIEDARRNLPPEVFDEQYRGLFQSRAGLVYPEFSVARHVVADAHVPRGSRVYRGVDFGFTQPFACVWASIHDGHLTVLRDYKATDATVSEHAMAILRVDDELRAQGFELCDTFCDPSRPGAILDLNRAGLRARRAKNRVFEGINRVRQLLRDGPRLTIDASCELLIKEFENYAWDESDDERRPVKRDDHALDALRYLVNGLRHHWPLLPTVAD